jgi:SWI/SNF-related matrix-associated actin-dependent regulator 1 of chromatin subfamily A
VALSFILKPKCKTCGADAIEVSRFLFGEQQMISLKCGHTQFEEIIRAADYGSITSTDGRKLIGPYQHIGVQFLEKANARALLADEPGLGKTVQAAALIKLHLQELTPVAVVTKATLLEQWMWEMFRWVGTKRVQILKSSKDFAVPGMDIYILTYDMLKNERMFEFVELKTLILDECQAIKNHLSGRAKATQKVAIKCEHIIGLSGTPIKNNAGEYFTILNLLQPSRFRDYARYLRDYCDSYETMYGMKVGGLKRPADFHEDTKDFILRRTKEEVLPDLPPLSRNLFHVELSSKVSAAYENALKELEALIYSDDTDMTATIAVMTKMRKLTGISKVTECVDFVVDHLLATERPIVVFTHHHTVTNLLVDNLNKWLKDGGYKPVLNLHSGLSPSERSQMCRDFGQGASRVMIASTLAAGEGLNLQFCSDAIMLERQWNPANEEQAESRFHRIGQKNAITVTYMLASETIDEYFTDLVEQKRAIVASTLDNKEISWDSNSLMRELAEILVSKGKKKWTL